MTDWFVSPYTGETIAIEQVKAGWRYGHMVSKHREGHRGKDKSPRKMNPKSLQNLIGYRYSIGMK